MDEVKETSKEALGFCQIIGKHNSFSHGWNKGKLYMEEIVFDFLCLEDDIVEDLCKDFPAQNNYQRYTVAHSYGFDRRKLSNVQLSEDRGFAGTDSSCQKQAAAYESTSDTRNSVSLSRFEDDYRQFRKSTQETLANPNKDGDQGFSGINLNGKAKKDQTTSQNQESEKHGPIVLRYELISLKDSENEEQKNCMNEKMKIKVELLKDLFVGDYLGKGDQSKEAGDSQSKTTKIKLRIPTSVITAEESNLRDFVIGCIKEKCDFTALMPNDAEVCQVNGKEHHC